MIPLTMHGFETRSFGGDNFGCLFQSQIRDSGADLG